MASGAIGHIVQKHRILFLTVFFAIYMFEYMVTLTFIDQQSMAIAPPAWQLGLHYLDSVLAAVGFGCFAPLRALFRRQTARLRLLMLPNLVYCVSMVALYFLRVPAAFAATALVAAFSLGVLGGMVYFCMALALAQTHCMGKVMAAGAAAAVAAQYLLQERLALAVLLPVVLAVGFSATLWLAVRHPWPWLREDCLPYAADSPQTESQQRRRLVILGVSVVALSLIGTFYDVQMMRLNVQTQYQQFNYYAWPRLLLIVGYGVIGFVGDIKKQAYVPIATLCVAFLAVFNPILFGEWENRALNMCIYYIFLGADVAYFNLMFWSLAPRTRCPALWAGMGRVIHGLAEFFWAASRIADLPPRVIVAIDILMFVVLVLTLAAGGYLLLGPGAESPAPAGAEPLTPQQRLQRYAAAYGLTPRETEVLEKLLTTEDGVQEIADSLYISRRMVQRYIASIYDKTETKTRIGLFQSYTAFAEQNI